MQLLGQKLLCPDIPAVERRGLSQKQEARSPIFLILNFRSELWGPQQQAQLGSTEAPSKDLKCVGLHHQSQPESYNTAPPVAPTLTELQVSTVSSLPPPLQGYSGCSRTPPNDLGPQASTQMPSIPRPLGLPKGPCMSLSVHNYRLASRSGHAPPGQELCLRFS